MNDPQHRVILAKLGLDGHDRGIKVVARIPKGCGYGSNLSRIKTNNRKHRGGR